MRSHTDDKLLLHRNVFLGKVWEEQRREEGGTRLELKQRMAAVL